MKEKHWAIPGRIPLKIAVNAAHRAFECNRALVLFMEKQVPLKKVYRIKSDLRHWLGEEQRVMQYQSQSIVLQSNAIHSPDAGELEWQNKVVGYFNRI